jgi:hypothetical protein
MESKLNFLEESPRVRKKVFNVLVECLQNLYHHTELNEGAIKKGEIETGSALIVIVREHGKFTIRTGNYIENKVIPSLSLKLDQINQLDKEGLQSMYRTSLKESEMSIKGTAGLGMIDIARKSGNKLEFEFLKVNEELSFFSLNVKID